MPTSSVYWNYLCTHHMQSAQSISTLTPLPDSSLQGQDFPVFLCLISRYPPQLSLVSLFHLPPGNHLSLFPSPRFQRLLWPSILPLWLWTVCLPECFWIFELSTLVKVFCAAIIYHTPTVAEREWIPGIQYPHKFVYENILKIMQSLETMRRFNSWMLTPSVADSSGASSCQKMALSGPRGTFGLLAEPQKKYISLTEYLANSTIFRVFEGTCW